VEKKASLGLCIGNFDGVHLGHRQILQALLNWKENKKNAESMLMSFAPHPKEYFKVPGFQKIYSQCENEAIIHRLGVDSFFWAEFNHSLAAQSKEEFFLFLKKKFPTLKKIIIGDDFNFAHARSASAEDLKKMCLEAAIDCEIIQCSTLSAETVTKVSSSFIRKLLLSGEVRAANQLLIDPFTISGVVEKGAQLGRKISFPTANIYFHKNQPSPLLANGVYATRSHIRGVLYEGVSNLGMAPTFQRSLRSLETHLFQPIAEVYDFPMSVEFIDRIRPERKFASQAELIEQIQIDVQHSRELLRRY